MLHSASNSLFTAFNKLLQRDEQTNHILLDAMNSLTKRLASYILMPSIMKDNAIKIPIIEGVSPTQRWSQARINSEGFQGRAATH